MLRAHLPRRCRSVCAQAKQSGNVFAAFTPVVWKPDGRFMTDPSNRTCIVSLVHEHGRPCRLCLRDSKDDSEEEEETVASTYCDADYGPCFGNCDVDLMVFEES